MSSVRSENSINAHGHPEPAEVVATPLCGVNKRTTLPREFTATERRRYNVIAVRPFPEVVA